MIKKLSLLLIVSLLFISCGKEVENKEEETKDVPVKQEIVEKGRYLTPEQRYDLSYQVWVLNDPAAKTEYTNILTELGEANSEKSMEELKKYEFLKKELYRRNKNVYYSRFVPTMKEITKDDLIPGDFRFKKIEEDDKGGLLIDLRTLKPYTGIAYTAYYDPGVVSRVYRVLDGVLIEKLLEYKHMYLYTYYKDNRPCYYRETNINNGDIFYDGYVIEHHINSNIKKSFVTGVSFGGKAYLEYDSDYILRRIDKVEEKKAPVKQKRKD